MDEHVLKTYLRADEVFVDGCGAEVRDATGRVWLDFLGGIAVSALGHAHPRLTAAIADQAGKVIHLSNLFRHPYTEEVARRVALLTGLDSVFFANSGAEANEAALKLSRKYQRGKGRPERMSFLALEGAFHGRTCGALSLTHNAKYREPFGPLLECSWVPPGDVAALENALHTLRPAALFLEPIQGEAGVRDVPHDYVRAARRLCTATDTVLVHDEVQAGCGRTGTFLAGDWAGVKPDIATLAKPIAAGLPLGLCVVAEPFAKVLQPGDHGSTFAGGPLACRAALVFLEELEEGGLLAAVRERGAELSAGLAALQREFPLISELRGRGLIQGVRLAEGAEEVQKDLYRRGLITNRTGGDTIRLLPPYVITSDQIQRGLRILRDALEARSSAAKSAPNPATVRA
ncbi:MAG: acetylornithine transaminase [Planctomycetota bacterium]|nr:acetylornithine transaminase [Planctomycetota bacterium]